MGVCKVPVSGRSQRERTTVCSVRNFYDIKMSINDV